MASRAMAFANPSKLALTDALAIIPSLPRPVLARLVSRCIERLDEIDGDPDLEEDNEDRCLAGDDGVFSGPAFNSNHAGFTVNPSLYCLGMDEDLEIESWRTFGAQS